MSQVQASERLVPVVRRVREQREADLQRLKDAAQQEAERDDFVWHMLLQSFATMGGSRGQEGLIRTPANYERLRYSRLAEMPREERGAEIHEVCTEAGLRWPMKKAEAINRAFDRIQNMGGPAAAKSALIELRDRDSKQSFFEAFYGIGPKYARNIMMDTYDVSFRNAIAVDTRIAKISKALGLSFSRPYPEHEQFYQGVAAAAGCEGWELDRLCYHYCDEIIAQLPST